MRDRDDANARGRLAGPTVDVTWAHSSDDDLVKATAAGDSRAFHALVDRHADRLYRLAVSLVGNATDAEDVLQESLAGAFRGASKFRGGATGRAWLTRILVTQAAKWWRDRKGKRPVGLIDDDVVSTAGRAGATEAAIDLRAALAKLSAEHREVLVLREFDGMAYEEMAQALGVPRGTIESRLSRARAELRRRLPSYEQA